MRLVIKRQFQRLAEHVTFPLFFYIYENGKIIGANEGAKALIGRETKNVNQIWKGGGKKRFSDKLRSGYSLLLNREKIEVKGYCLEMDMELCFLQMDQEHIVIVLMEQSYKRAFQKRNHDRIPRVFWKDKRLHIRGQNYICQWMVDEAARLEPGYEASRIYDREILKKAFSYEEKLIEEQRESYGDLQQIKQGSGRRGFGQVNRLPLINKNGNCIGILIIYEVLQEKEETGKQEEYRLRQLEALEASLREEKKIAYSIREDKRGSVAYLSDGIEDFGYKTEEFYSGGYGWLDIVCEEDKKKLEEQEKIPGKLEYRIWSKEGKKIWLCDKRYGFSFYQNSIFRQGAVWQIEKEGE